MEFDQATWWPLLLQILSDQKVCLSEMPRQESSLEALEEVREWNALLVVTITRLRDMHQQGAGVPSAAWPDIFDSLNTQLKCFGALEATRDHYLLRCARRCAVELHEKLTSLRRIHVGHVHDAAHGS
jgi:hypothetical protein